MAEGLARACTLGRILAYLVLWVGRQMGIQIRLAVLVCRPPSQRSEIPWFLPRIRHVLWLRWDWSRIGQLTVLLGLIVVRSSVCRCHVSEIPTPERSTPPADKLGGAVRRRACRR